MPTNPTGNACARRAFRGTRVCRSTERPFRCVGVDHTVRPSQAVPSREGTPVRHDQHQRPARNPPSADRPLLPAEPSTYAVSSGVSFRCRQGVSFECRLTARLASADSPDDGQPKRASVAPDRIGSIVGPERHAALARVKPGRPAPPVERSASLFRFATLAPEARPGCTEVDQRVLGRVLTQHRRPGRNAGLDAIERRPEPVVRSR